MKRTVLVLICALTASCALFASFDGHSSLSGVYTYNDGTHYLGIGSDSFGFVNDFPLGYYAGIDASFSTQDISDWRIGMIAGPAYSCDFGDSGVSCDVAAGISMDGTPDAFSFGLGGYIGARWKRDGSLDEAVEYAYQLRSRLMRVDDICEAIMSRYCLHDAGLRSVMRRAGLISGE